MTNVIARWQYVDDERWVQQRLKRDVFRWLWKAGSEAAEMTDEMVVTTTIRLWFDCDSNEFDRATITWCVMWCDDTILTRARKLAGISQLSLPHDPK